MPSKRLDPKSICLAVVTYFPEKSFFDRFPVLSSRFGGSVIVDNHSPHETIKRIKSLGKKADVLLNPSNLGLAYALNQAARKAIERSFSWVLLMDQDSDLDEGFLRAYGNVLAAYPPKTPLGVIGNNYLYAV